MSHLRLLYQRFMDRKFKFLRDNVGQLVTIYQVANLVGKPYLIHKLESTELYLVNRLVFIEDMFAKAVNLLRIQEVHY